jgi:hypothetical protein
MINSHRRMMAHLPHIIHHLWHIVAQRQLLDPACRDWTTQRPAAIAQRLSTQAHWLTLRAVEVASTTDSDQRVDRHLDLLSIHPDRHCHDTGRL